MENLGCYLSNSSGYGDLVWKTPASTTVFKSNSGSQEHLSCHSPVSLNDFNMGSFSLSPIDFEPLPNLFSFGPCPATYKDFPPVYKEKNPHDMADVLLSLKHAVVHPGQMSPISPVSNYPSYGQQASSINTGPPTSSHGATRVSPTSVSFSVHPQAQVMSPHAHHGYAPYGHQYPDATSVASSSAASGVTPSHQNIIGGPTSQGNIFPSMSVNVSMNMTMGVPPGMSGVPNPYNMMEQMNSPHHHHHHHQQQLQWGSTSGPMIGPSTTSTHPTTSFAQTQNLMGPLQMSYSANPTSHSSYGPTGSYSFTAEFRPNSACNDPTFDKEFSFKNVSMNVTPFKPLKPTTNYSFSPVQKRSSSAVARLPSLSTTIANRNLLRDDFHLGQTLSDAVSKVNLCRICGKTYARPSTLKTHMRTHSGEKPYRCSTCSKSFSQAANLTAHIRTHSGEKPFRCPICDRRFSQSSSVTTHMRTHSGERPYRCRMCKKAFSDSSTLTKHLRIHSGEKPYQCTLCLLRFSQSGNLNRHMRVHSNQI